MSDNIVLLSGAPSSHTKTSAPIAIGKSRALSSQPGFIIQAKYMGARSLTMPLRSVAISDRIPR